MKGGFIVKTIWQKYRDTSLVVKISIALIFGIIFGLTFGEPIVPIIEPFGDLLMRLLQFIMVPLILFTLISGTNQTDMRNLASVGGKVTIYYIATTAFAIVIGLIVATIFSPGTGLSLSGQEAFETPENPGVIHVLLSIVPTNIIEAFLEPNLLGIIFTAIVFGIAILSLRSTKKFTNLGNQLYTLVEGLNEATFRIMEAILQYIPIGIFAIASKTIASNGVGTLFSLGEMVIVLYVALLIHLAFYLITMYFTGVSPLNFLKNARVPMLTAFITQSSTGTIPLTINAAKNLGVPKSLYSFSIPFGATVNMDGAAIRIAVSAVFAANVVGTPLSIPEMLQIILVGTLISIGTAGIPGAGIVMIATVFSQVGLPMEAVGLLAAIDVLVGMGCTCVNVTGDLAGTTIIDRLQKKDKTDRIEENKEVA